MVASRPCDSSYQRRNSRKTRPLMDDDFDGRAEKGEANGPDTTIGIIAGVVRSRAMTSRADSELSELLELGDRIVGMATKGGITVAECMLRSGAELSARVRLDKPELVEEAAHRSAGLRVMK